MKLVAHLSKPALFRRTVAVLAGLVLGCAGLAAVPARVTDSTAQLPSGKVFYRDSGGKGTPVVFLHAGSGNSMLWEQQIPAFTNAGYRFIAVDYRGAGDAPRDRNSGHSTALINELSVKLGVSKFHLLGTGAGGNVALRYALANRDKLRSLVIANSSGNVRDLEQMNLGKHLHLRSLVQLPLEARELGPSYRATNPDGVKRWLELTNQRREGSAADGPGRGDDQATYGEGAKRDNGYGGMGGGQSESANDVTWAGLAKLNLPALLITGSADLFTPPAVLRMLAANMKPSETAIIADSGRSPYWESPDEFNRTVLAFISKY